MILYRRKRYNLFARWTAAVLAASMIVWTVAPGVVLAQPAPVPNLNAPAHSAGTLDPVFNIATNSQSAQTWEYVISQGKFTLAAQWEAAVNTEIEGHLSSITQSDHFNSPQEYRDYLRKELLVQKQEAFADWELALDAEIEGERLAFLSDLSDRRLQEAQEDSDDAIDSGRTTATDPNSTSAEMEGDREAWDEEFQQSMQSGFAEYQLALGALQQEYTSLLNELALKDAEFQSSLEQIDAYEQRVRDGIQSTVANLESLLQNNGFFYQETCGGPHGSNCSTDMNQLNAAGTELQNLLASIKQDLANDAPLSAIAVQMTDYMQRRQAEAAARTTYWNGLINGTVNYDQIIDTGWRLPTNDYYGCTSASCPDRTLPTNQNAFVASIMTLGHVQAVSDYHDHGSLSTLRTAFSEFRNISSLNGVDIFGATALNPLAHTVYYNLSNTGAYGSSIKKRKTAEDILNSQGAYSTEGTSVFLRSQDIDYSVIKTSNPTQKPGNSITTTSGGNWTRHIPESYFRIVVNYDWHDPNAENNRDIWSNYNNALSGMLTRWRDELLPAIQNWESQVATYRADYAAWQAEADVQRATAAAAFQGGQADLVQSRNRWLARMEEEYRSGEGDWAQITKTFEKERDGIAAASAAAAPRLSAEFLNRGRGNRPDLENLAKFEQGIQQSLQGSLNFAVADTLNSQALDIRQKQFEAISSVLNPYSEEDLRPFSAEDKARLEYLEGLVDANEALEDVHGEEIEALQDKKDRKDAAKRFQFTIEDQGGQIVANRAIANGELIQIGGDGSSVNDYVAATYNQSVVIAAPSAVQLVSTPDLFDVWDTGEVVGSFYDGLEENQQQFKEQLAGVQENVVEANRIAQSGWDRYFENAQDAAARVTLMKKLMKSAILGMLGGASFHAAFGGALESHVRGQFASQLEEMTGVPATFLSALLGGADVGEALGSWAESVFWDNVQNTFNLSDDVTQLVSMWVSSEIAKAQYRQDRREAARFQPEDMLGGALTYAWRNQQYHSDLNTAMTIGETAAGILLNSVGNIIPGLGTAIWMAYNSAKQTYLGSLNGGTTGAFVGSASGALNAFTSQYGVNVGLSYSFEDGYGGSVGVGIPLGEGGPQLGLNMNFQEGEGITSYGAGLSGDTWNAGFAVGADGNLAGNLSFGTDDMGFGLNVSDGNGIGAALTSEYGNLVYDSDNGFSYSTPSISYDIGGFTGDVSYNTATGLEMDGEGYGLDLGYGEDGLTIGTGGDDWEAGYNLTTGEAYGSLDSGLGNLTYDSENGFGYNTGDISYDVGGVTGSFSYDSADGWSVDGAGYGMDFSQDEDGLSFGGDWSAGDLDFGYDSENGFTAALGGAGDDLLAYNEQDGLTSPYAQGLQDDLTEQFETISNLDDIESQVAAAEDLLNNPGDYVDLNPFGDDPFSNAPDLGEMFPDVFGSDDDVDNSDSESSSGDIASIIESITGDRNGEVPPPEDERPTDDSTNTVATDDEDSEPIANAPPPNNNNDDANRPKPIAAAPAASSKPKPAKLFSQSLTRDINAGVKSGIPRQPALGEEGAYWRRHTDRASGQVYFAATFDDGRRHRLIYTDEGLLRQDIWHSNGDYAGAKIWDANGNIVRHGYYIKGGGAPKLFKRMQTAEINIQSTYTDPAGNVWKKKSSLLGESTYFERYVDGQRQTLTFQSNGVVKQQIFRKEYRKVKSSRNGRIITQLVDVPHTKFWDADGKELGVWAQQLNAKEQAEFNEYWGIKKEEETIMQTEVDTDDLAAIEEYRDRAAAALGLKREEYKADLRGPRRDRVRYCTASRSVCYGMQPENARTSEDLIDRWKETDDFQAYLREPLGTKAIDRDLLHDLRKGLENAQNLASEYSRETVASLEGALAAIGEALKGGGMDAINEFAVSDPGIAFIDNLALGVIPVVGDVQTFFEATKQIYAGENLAAALTIGTGVASMFARPFKALFRIGADKVTKAKKALKRGEIEAPRKKPGEYSKAEQEKAIANEKAKRKAQDEDGNGYDPCPTRSCFAAGTVVLTPDGFRTIEAIEAGEAVVAFDPFRSRQYSRSVVQAYELETLHWFHLTVGDETLVVTGNHRFWVPENETWIRVENLRVGMQLRSADGSDIPVRAIREEPLAEPALRYDIDVEEHHNFFAGKQKILVHNCYSPLDNIAPKNRAPLFQRILPKDLRKNPNKLVKITNSKGKQVGGKDKVIFDVKGHPNVILAMVTNESALTMAKVQKQIADQFVVRRARNAQNKNPLMKNLRFKVVWTDVAPMRIPCQGDAGATGDCIAFLKKKVPNAVSTDAIGDAGFFDESAGTFYHTLLTKMKETQLQNLKNQLDDLKLFIEKHGGLEDLEGIVDYKTGDFYLDDIDGLVKTPGGKEKSLEELNSMIRQVLAAAEAQGITLKDSQ